MKYDLIVVGGGAAGLLSAGHAGELGLNVLVLEKMPRVARKLRITGKGRCNITNTAPLNEYFKHISPNPKFLYPAFKSFFNDDIVSFIENTLHVPTKEERGGRIFPVSDKAQDIVDGLYNWCIRNKVTIKTDTEISNLLIFEEELVGVLGTDEKEYYAKHVIMATGGKSYPLTGSTGIGHRILKEQGHKISPLLPALAPLNTKETNISDLMGVSLKNVSASVYVNGKKHASEFGEMLFAHFGLTGPIILTLSRTVNKLLHRGDDIEISIDFKPALNDEVMKERLLREIEKFNKRRFDWVLKTLFPGKLVPFCAEYIKVPLEKPVSQITAKERTRLHRFCKDLRFHITSTRPIEEAIVTAGGVHLNEINQKTMESKIIKGLYVVGELLDLDADTGGYNLQIAWSTAWLAAESIAEDAKS